jgi:hypothetical protein
LTVACILRRRGSVNKGRARRSLISGPALLEKLRCFLLPSQPCPLVREGLAFPPLASSAISCNSPSKPFPPPQQVNLAVQESLMDAALDAEAVDFDAFVRLMRVGSMVCVCGAV